MDNQFQCFVLMDFAALSIYFWVEIIIERKPNI